MADAIPSTPGGARMLLGQTLTFAASPLLEGPAAARHETHGGVVIGGGRILDAGPAERLRAAHPGLPVTDYGAALISPGFVDAHVHYPQTAIIASWGRKLIDWLGTYTFPEELRFADPGYAAAIAARFFDLALAHGTTTSCSFGTVYPHSVDAFFAEAERRGLRALCGKVAMDRHAPEGLTDTPETAYDASKALLERWHGRGRLSYVISPRFAPTSTPEQLAAMGALWAEHPECLMQTHLAEQTAELAWVAALYPAARDYLDVYEAAGLVGPRALFGHGVHLAPRERARLRETGAALAHCPTSNAFIGSGLFDLPGLAAEGQRIGLATDVGGGSSFSMLRTMAAAYEIAHLGGTAVHPAALWWLATAGSAEALHLGDRIGGLGPGMDADLVVIDLASTSAIAQRAARAESFWEALFPTIMMGDDRAVEAVWIGGVPAARPVAAGTSGR